MQGKISVDEAINQLLSGSEEKMAKIKKNVEDIGNGKIKGINTSAYTSSLNTVSQKAKSTAKDTDKSNKEIKKNSKLKGTNNTAAAKQTYGAYKTEGEKAKNTVKKTGKELGKSGATSVASTTSQWKSAGSKNAKSYISGIASQKGAAQKAGKTLSTSAKTGASWKSRLCISRKKYGCRYRIWYSFRDSICNGSGQKCSKSSGKGGTKGRRN